MAAKKLSEITPSSNVPASIDQIVGVSGGTADVLYSLSQIATAVGAGQPVAGANLTFYVATTGSDNNPGSAAQPFATITKALSVAGSYVWTGGFAPTINIADGTYTYNSTIVVPQLQAIASEQQGSIVGNVTTPANVVIKVTGGGNVFEGGGTDCRWSFSGLQTDGSAGHYKADSAAVFTVGTVNLTDTTANAGSGVTAFWARNFGRITVQNTNNYLAAKCLFFCNGNFDARLSFSGTINFPGTGCQFQNTFFALTDDSVVLWQGITVGNQNLLTSAVSPEGAFQSTNGSHIYTAHGVWTDLPFGTQDATCAFNVDSSVFLAGATSGFATVLGAASNLGFVSRMVWPVGGPHTGQNLEMGSIVEVSAAAPTTYTLPSYANVPLPPGTEITVVQSGAGAVTLTPDTGVTIHGTTVTSGQWTGLRAYKRDLGRSTPSDEWVAMPGL